MPRRSALLPLLFAACARPFGTDPFTSSVETGSPGGIAIDSGVLDAGGPPDARLPRAPVAWHDVTTQHNDAARTGANLAEYCLRPENVASLAVDRRFQVTGQIYAQPLVANHLLVVATTANELAAFDLDSNDGARKWSLGRDVLGTPGNVVRNVSGPLGILSTPAIDVPNDRLFVVARSCPSPSALLGCGHHLFSVRLSTGAVLDEVEVAPPGFDPDWQWNRPGLLLMNGLLYAAWGVGQSGNQHEEEVVYHGWVMAFRADDLHAPPLVHSTTEHGRGGGIWQAGAGLAGDGEAVFATTGNSIRDVPVTSPIDFPTAPVDDENSAVRLRFDASGVAERATYFDPRPYMSDGNVFQYMERWDIDFSSAGPVLLPGTDDFVVGAKSGILYLLDRKTLTALQPPLSAFTEPPLAAGQSLYIFSYVGGPQVLGAPVVWNDSLYVWPRNDRLVKLQHDRTLRTLVVEARSSVVAGAGGGMLSLSADGPQAGIVWVSLSSSGIGGISSEIAAFDATTLEKKWSAPVTGYAKFTCPTVSAGHVFVASWNGDGSSEVVEYDGACK
jgi:hypothetical protein